MGLLLQTYSRLAPALVAIIELTLMIGAGLLIVLDRRRAPAARQSSFVEALRRRFTQLARRRALAIFVVGAGVVVVRVALIPVLGVPQPRWNDEFSYLLAADTFAHGRVTNPTHPMWIHFETFHIIEQPTYMSMYPPAQGLVLAAGQILGHPWIGQLLITGVLCSVFCWMLQAWLPPRWALLGAVLAALRLGIMSYWMNGYWSASVVALGGALVLGAWPRIRRNKNQVWNAALMAAGLAILANSRPYEGLLFSVPFAAAMGLWLFRERRKPQTWIRVVLALVLLLGLAAVATGYYYDRVTGSPFRMTYQVNRETYATAPYFLWEKARPEPQYYHRVIRDFYRWELAQFQSNRTLIGVIRRSADKFVPWWNFYLGPLLTLPLLAFPWILRDRRMRFPLMALAFFVAGLVPQTWTLPHYFAPAAGLLYLILLQCMRHLRLWGGRKSDKGAALIRMIVALSCGMILLRVGAAAVHAPIEPAWPRGNLDRAAIVRQLRALPGRHLVIVDYQPSYRVEHDADHEWVSNDADIDNAKIVWARDMGAQNEELLRYFASRRIWQINGDAVAPELKPYTPHVSADSSAGNP